MYRSILTFTQRIFAFMLLIVFCTTANAQCPPIFPDGFSTLSSKISACAGNSIITVPIVPTGNTILQSPTMTLTLPTGVHWGGFVSPIPSGVTVSVAEPTVIISGLPNISAGAPFTLKYYVNADFSAALQPSVLYKLAYSGGQMCTDDGNPLTIDRPMLNFLSVTPTNAAVLQQNGTFTRTLRFCNDGLGAINYNILVSDTHTADLTILSATAGGVNIPIAANNKDMTLTAASFGSDGQLTKNECVEIVQTIRVNGCGNANGGLISSIRGFIDGCLNTADTYTNILPGNATLGGSPPNLIVTSAITGLDSTCYTTPRTQIYTFTNTGIDTARNVVFDLMQSGFVQLVGNPTLTINGVNGTVTQSGALTFSGAAAASSCMGAASKNSGKFTLPNIPAGKTVELRYNIASCCKTACDAFVATSSPVLSYNKLCGNPGAPISTALPGLNASVIYEAQELDYPTDVKGGECVNIDIINNNIVIPYKTNGSKIEVVIDVPGGFTPKAPYKLTLADNSAVAPLTSTFSGGKLTLTYNYSDIKDLSYSTWSLDFCTSTCPSCSEGIKNFGIAVNLKPSGTCVGCTGTKLYCGPAASIYQHCPGCGPGICQGVLFSNYTMKRTSFCQGDLGNDRTPDTMFPDTSLLKLRRAMVGDTITTVFNGKIITSAANPTWTYLYARDTMPLFAGVPIMTPKTGTVQIYRNGALICSKSLIPTITTGSGKSVSNFDLSVPTLSCGSLINYKNGDSVVVKTKYQVTQNVGATLLPISTRPGFYTQAAVNSTTRYSCDFWTNTFTIVGYSNTITGFSNAAAANTDISCAGSGPGIRFKASYGGVSNPFPYEFRNFSTPDSFYITVPAGYSLSNLNARLEYGGGKVATIANILPTGVASASGTDTRYRFFLTNLFSNVLPTPAGKLPFPDESYELILTPTYNITTSECSSVAKNVTLGGKFNNNCSLESIMPYSNTINDNLSPLKFKTPTYSTMNMITRFKEQKEECFDFMPVTDNPAGTNYFMRITPPTGVTISRIIVNGSNVLPIATDNTMYFVGPNTSIKICARYTNCAVTDIINVDFGYQCNSVPPVNFASLVCPTTPFQLKLLPIQTPAAIQISPTPVSTIPDLCQPIEMSVLVRNSGINYLYDPKFRAFLPPFLNYIPGSAKLSWNGVNDMSIPDPIVLPNTGTAVANDNILNFNFNTLTGVFDSLKLGLAGSGTTQPLKKEYELTFSVRADCGYKANSPIFYSTSFTDPCGKVIKKDAFGGKIPINVVNSYTSSYNLTGDLSTVMTCGPGTPVNLKVTNTGFGSTSNTDTIYVTLPNTVFIKPSSVMNVVNMASTFTKRAIGNDTIYKFKINAGVGVNGMMTTDFRIWATVNAPCDLVDTVDFEVISYKNGTCASSNTSCATPVSTGNYEAEYTVKKPSVGFTTNTLTNLNTATGTIVSINVKNKGAIPLEYNSGTRIKIYSDSDNSSTLTAADVLLDDSPYIPALAPGGSSYYYKNIITTLPKCPILAVIMGNCICGMDVQSTSACNTPPFCNANKSWALPAAICEGSTATFVSALASADTLNYNYSWTFYAANQVNGAAVAAPFKTSGAGPHVVKWNMAGSYQVKLKVELKAFPAGCKDSLEQIFPVNAIPIMTDPADITVECENTSIDVPDFMAAPNDNVSWTWSNNNTAAITLAASGTGQLPIFQNKNNTGTTNQVATITAYPTRYGCQGLSQTFTVTVKPTPLLTSVFTNPVVCPTNLITIPTFTGSVYSVSSYTWTNSNTADGITTTIGSGQIASYNAPANNTQANIVGTVAVTANFVSTPVCKSTRSFTITIKPTPVLNALTDISKCPGETYTVPVFGLTPNSGTRTYAWTNTNTLVGINAISGNGQIANYIAPANNSSVDIVSTVTVTPTRDACVGLPKSFTVTLKPKPVMSTPANITVCPGEAVDFTDFTSDLVGTTYMWSHSNATVGLAALNGTAQVPTFTSANTTNAVITSNFSATGTAPNGCKMTVNFSVSVKPKPYVTNIANASYCVGDQVITNFITNPTGAAIDWTNATMAIGFSIPNGTGNIPNFTATNTTNSVINSNLTAQANLNGCAGDVQSYVITVKPKPTVTTPANVTVCTGEPIDLDDWVSDPSGAMFNWTNSNPAVGINGSGNGQIALYNAPVNNSGANFVGTLAVTPVINGCTGTPVSSTITIKPTPIINNISNIIVCPNMPVSVPAFTSVPASAAFTWLNDNTNTGLLTNFGSNDIPTFTSAANNTSSNVVSNISVTTILNGCPSPTLPFSITVRPTPMMNAPANVTVCANDLIAVNNFTSIPTGASFDWTNSDIKIGKPLTGNGQILPYTAPSNFTAAPFIGNFAVTPTLNTCVGPTQNFSITVNPRPTLNTPTDITICATNIINPDDWVSNILGATYTWTNSNTSIGLAASGSNQIADFVGINTGISDQTATIVGTATSPDGCTYATTFKITVKPLPTLSGFGSTEVCPNVPVNFNFGSNINGATYTWTNDNTAIGLGASGNGNIAFTSTNSTNAPIQGNILVTPSFNGCSNVPYATFVVVKPKPILAPLADITVCPTELITPATFVSNPIGSTFSWTNTNINIGLGVTGSGQIAPYNAPFNNTGVNETGLITATPELNGCVGEVQNMTITVKPTPTITNPIDIEVCPGTVINPLDLATNVSGAIFDWSQTNPLVGLATVSGNGQIPTFTAAANATNVPIVSTFTISAAANSCTSAVRSFNVTVKPTPTMNTPANITKCPTQIVNVDDFVSTPTGAAFNWTATNFTNVGISAGISNGQIADYAAPANNSNILQTSTITVTPELNACFGLPISFKINISPTPEINPLTDKVVCPTQLIDIDNFTSNPTGATYEWINTNTDIGLPLSGINQIADYIAPANDGSDNVTSTVIIKPTLAGCVGPTQSFDITIKPKPNVNSPGDVFVCSGDLINIDAFASNVSGATYNWTNSTIADGKPLSGSGQIPNYNAPLNSTGDTIKGVFILKSFANGCASSPDTFKVNIFPKPVLTAIPDLTVCPGELIDPVDFSSNVVGANLSWENNNINTGLSANDVMQIVPTNALANTTNANIVSSINYTYEKDGCSSSIGTFKIAVKPTPTVKTVANVSICPSTSLNPDDWESLPTGATYTWTNNNTATGLGANGIGQLPTFVTNPTPLNTDVVSTVTITPMLNGCVGTDFLYDITVIGQPSLNVPTPVIVCPGEPIEIVFVGGSTTTYSWTNSNTAIGLPASGTNNIITYNAPANNTGANVLSTIVVTPSVASCVGTSQTFEVTIKPTPDVLPFADQTVCPGDNVSINFGSSFVGTTYSWVNYSDENMNIGLAENGVGNVSFTTLANGTLSNLTTRVTATPLLNGCKGPTKEALINVKPTPQINVPQNITVCAGETVTIDEIISTLPGATIAWTNSDPLVGLAATTGTGQVPTFTAAANASGVNIVSTFTAKAILNGCDSPTQTFTVTVKPTPTVNDPIDISVCAGEVIDIDDFVSAPAGATYEWTNDNTKIGLASSGNGQIATYNAPANNTAITQIGNLTVQATLNGCKSVIQDYVVSLKPTPTMFDPQNVIVCPLDMINISTFTSTPVGANYTWTATNTDTGLPGLNGVGQIADYAAPTNISGADYVTTVTVTPTLNLCVGLPQSFEITVKGTPTVAPTQSITVCAGEPIEANFIGGSLTTFTWTNDNIFVGLPLLGLGSIAPYTAPANATGANIVANLVVTPIAASCVGGNQLFTITIKPTPEVTQPPTVVACPGQPAVVVFAGSNTGNSYSWTNDNTNSGLTNNGVGNISFVTDANNTNLDINSNITVTPTLNGCAGVAKTFLLTNQPSPLVAQPSNIRVCAGQPINVDDFMTTPSGATFVWSNNNSLIGLTTSGSGDVATYNAPANNTEYDQIASLTVTATLSTCKSVTKNFEIVVKPTPLTHNVTDIVVCPTELVEINDFKSTPIGTTYAWANDNTFIGLGASGNGQIQSFTAPENASGMDSIARIIVTPILEGCVGTPDTFKIKLKGTPFVNDVICIEVCPGEPIDIDYVGTPGATFSWTNTNTDIGLPATGVNDVKTYFAPSNNTGAIIKGMLEVVPSLNACIGGSQMFEINIKPTPTLDMLTDIETCPEDSIKLTMLGSIDATTYLWKNSNIAIGLPLNGQGNIAYKAPLNNGLTKIHSTLQVKPVKNLCYGAQQTISIDVKPKPKLNKPSNITVCSGELIDPMNFVSSPTGAQFVWNNDSLPIGLPSAGIGQFTTYVAPINNSGGDHKATISAVAILDNCISDTVRFTITIKPKAVVNILNDIVICAGDSVDVMKVMGNTSGTMFSWTNDNTRTGLIINGLGQVPKFLSKNDTSINLVSNIFINSSSNGCAGESQMISVTVKPKPIVAQVTNVITSCPKEIVDLQFDANQKNSTFNWTANNQVVGQAALSGIDFIPPFSLSVNNTDSLLKTIFVYTAQKDACVSDPKTFTIAIKPTPQLPICKDIIVCAGEKIEIDTVKSKPAGATFVWYCDNVAVGLPEVDTTNFFSYNAPANNTKDTIVANILFRAYLDGCESGDKTFTIKIKPSPSLIQTNDETVCPGDSIRLPNFESIPAGSQLAWTNDNTLVGLGANGVGNIPNFKTIAKNISGANMTASIIVTPTLNGCVGINDTLLLNIKQTPSILPVADIVTCPEDIIPGIALISTNNSEVTWVNSNPLLGIADDGVGNIASFDAPQNTTLDSIKSVIKLVASAEQCLSDTASFRIIIKPSPRVLMHPNYSICSSDSLKIVFNGEPGNPTFAWTNSNPNIGLAATGTGDILFKGTTNTSDSSTIATIYVTPTLNGCIGRSNELMIEVTSKVRLTAMDTVIVCAGDIIDIPTFVAQPSGANYSWTNSNTAIGLGTNGVGQIESYISPINTSDTTIVSKINVLATIGTCTSDQQAFYILIHPRPVMMPMSNFRVCSGDSIYLDNFSSSLQSSTIFKWSANNTITGIAPTGEGAISFISDNPTLMARISRVSIFPVVGQCVGTAETFDITVTPTAQLDTTLIQLRQTVCSEMPLKIDLNGVVNGTNFKWENDNPNIGLPANGEGNIDFNTILNNTGLNQTATVRILPILNGCVGQYKEIQINLKASDKICSPMKVTRN